MAAQSYGEILKLELAGSSEMLVCKKVYNITPIRIFIFHFQVSRPKFTKAQLYIQSLQMLKTEILITRGKLCTQVHL